MSGQDFNTSCPTCAKRWAAYEPGLCAKCLIAACEGRDEVFGSPLNRLAAIVHEVSVSKGFHDKPVPMGDYAANIHGEVSELFEAYRRGILNEPCDKASKMEEPLTCFEEEAADIIIRTLDMAADKGLDMDRAVRIKTAFNRTRERMHGKIA